MRSTLLLLFCLCLGHYLQAQQRSPAIVAPGGATAKGQSMTLEWTLGELAVQTITTSNGLLTEGFHQPILQVEVALIAPTTTVSDDLQIKVAPNPVRSWLSITLEAELKGQAIIDLWNLQGQHLERQITATDGTNLEWDMTPYPSGIYQLSFSTEEGELLRTFKISKID